MRAGILLASFVIPLLRSAHLAAAPPIETSDPSLVHASKGWAQKLTDSAVVILHTREGGGGWLDVSPPALRSAVKRLVAEHEKIWLPQMATLQALDGRRAWVSIIPPARNVVYLEFTADAGRHWQEKVAPIAADAADIDFLDERRGYLLALSNPAAGLMKKAFYGTSDGGHRWHPLSVPSAPSFYPTGISFRSKLDGWITATYHGGDDAPLYRTRDGGKSWKLQSLPIPAGYQGGYADSYPPVFVGAKKSKGYLPVKLVRHDPKPGHIAWVNYETEDDGKTWHLPVSGIPSTPEE